MILNTFAPGPNQFLLYLSYYLCYIYFNILALFFVLDTALCYKMSGA